VKEHSELACNPLEIVQQLLLDPLLSADADLVDHLGEEIDEAIGHFTATEPAQCRHQRGPERRRVRSQFVRGLGSSTLAKSFDDSQRDVVEETVGQPETAQALELSDLGDDAF